MCWRRSTRIRRVIDAAVASAYWEVQRRLGTLVSRIAHGQVHSMAYRRAVTQGLSGVPRSRMFSEHLALHAGDPTRLKVGATDASSIGWFLDHLSIAGGRVRRWKDLESRVEGCRML